MRGTGWRRGWLAGLGALALLTAGVAIPQAALAQSVRIESHRSPGAMGQWRSGGDWRRPGWDWGDRGHRDWGHPGNRFIEKGPHHRNPWKPDHGRHFGHHCGSCHHGPGVWWGGVPAPVWVPPYWAWDGWRWVWVPGYWR